MTLIYESPDGGKTVRAREFRHGPEPLTSLEDYKQWTNILVASKTNPVLQQAVDQCIMIYKLSKEYNDA
jgi:CO dehydrogenase/acetyl-CoA synthase alpha subunit